MTSLLPPSARSRGAAQRPGPGPIEDLRHRRPLALLAAAGGVAAASATLVVFLGLGVVGWFLTDGGAHGTPRDGLRSGALGWLVGHGSGLRIEGVAVTAVPLGVTALVAWTLWRVGLRVGDSVSGHGPDVRALEDGGRDWTVPVASGLFTAGYVVTAVLVAAVAATPDTDPSTPRVVVWSLLLCALVAAPAIAVGSGRMPVWAALVPRPVRSTLRLAVSVLIAWLAVSAVTFVAALVVDVDTAANIFSQLGAGPGDVVLFGTLMLLVVPNALAFSGAYLLGPGFTVGVGTLVTPQAAVVGALPMFPMLAALPDDGPAPGWTLGLTALPVLVALVAAGHAQWRLPSERWEEGLLRGCAGGILAGVAFALLSVVAGGAVGPGRMREVGPLAADVLVHGVTAFGIGGLLGAAAVTWWQRRGARSDAGD